MPRAGLPGSHGPGQGDPPGSVGTLEQNVPASHGGYAAIAGPLARGHRLAGPLLVALARPQWGTETHEVEQQGIEVALDRLAFHGQGYDT